MGFMPPQLKTNKQAEIVSLHCHCSNDLSGQNGRPGKRMLSQNILASGPKMQTEISSASTTIKVPIILEFQNLNVNKELRYLKSHFIPKVVGRRI